MAGTKRSHTGPIEDKCALILLQAGEITQARGGRDAKYETKLLTWLDNVIPKKAIGSRYRILLTRAKTMLNLRAKRRADRSQKRKSHASTDDKKVKKGHTQGPRPACCSHVPFSSMVRAQWVREWGSPRLGSHHLPICTYLPVCYEWEPIGCVCPRYISVKHSLSPALPLSTLHSAAPPLPRDTCLLYSSVQRRRGAHTANWPTHTDLG